MSENINMPSLLGGLVFQIVDDEIFPDDENDENPKKACLLLLSLAPRSGLQNHPENELSYLSVHFPDRETAAKLFRRLANQMEKGD